MRSQSHPEPRTPQTDVVGLTTTGADRGLRAGDEDRRRVTDLLQTHYVAGRLTQIEFEGRLQEAVAARTLADLDALLADLPDLAPPATPATVEEQKAHGSRHLRHGGRCGEQSFRAHATSYLLVMALLVGIWALTSPGGYFWPAWPMLGWGIGLASHGLAARRQGGQRAGELGGRHWRALSSH